jgi:excisionase family DNA binding protein
MAVTRTIPEDILSRTWFNVSQAAVYMNCTHWYVEEAIRKGRIPFARLGKRFIVKRQDCDAHVESLKETVTAETE